MVGMAMSGPVKEEAWREGSIRANLEQAYKESVVTKARYFITAALAQLDEMERDHEATKKTVLKLMLPIEALLMAYSEKDAKPIGLTQGVWDAIRKNMPIVRVKVLGIEEERKAVLAILGKREETDG